MVIMIILCGMIRAAACAKKELKRYEARLLKSIVDTKIHSILLVKV